MSLVDALKAIQRYRPSSDISRNYLLQLLIHEEKLILNKEDGVDLPSGEISPELAKDLAGFELPPTGQETFETRRAFFKLCKESISAAVATDNVLNALSTVCYKLKQGTEISNQGILEESIFLQLRDSVPVYNAICAALVAFVDLDETADLQDLLTVNDIVFRQVLPMSSFHAAFERRVVRFAVLFRAFDPNRCTALATYLKSISASRLAYIFEAIVSDVLSSSSRSAAVSNSSGLSVVVASTVWPIRLLVPPGLEEVSDAIALAPHSIKRHVRVSLPSMQIASLWRTFQTSYESDFPGRSLSLLPHLGTASLEFRTRKNAVRRRVSCPTSVLMLLAALYDEAAGADTPKTAASLQAQLGMSDRLFNISLRAATASKDALIRKEGELLTLTDSLDAGKPLRISFLRSE